MASCRTRSPTGDVAGAVVVVVKDGETLLHKGYGYADVAARKPVDPATTLFRTGSVSKLTTWTAVMQLVEQGKLDLDADVNGYLDFEIPAREGQPITLRQIMTHTPGFEERIKDLIIPEGESFDPLDVYLKHWVPTRIFAPGTTPAYPNYATALAGYIVARVSGLSFDDYVEQHIFAPLGMQHSTFRQPLPENLRVKCRTVMRGPRRAKALRDRCGRAGGQPVRIGRRHGAIHARAPCKKVRSGKLGSSGQTAEQMHTTALTVLPRVDRMVLGFYETESQRPAHHLACGRYRVVPL